MVPHLVWQLEQKGQEYQAGNGPPYGVLVSVDLSAKDQVPFKSYGSDSVDTTGNETRIKVKQDIQFVWSNCSSQDKCQKVHEHCHHVKGSQEEHQTVESGGQIFLFVDKKQGKVGDDANEGKETKTAC